MSTNPSTSKFLLILTWNSNGLTKHKNELLATLQNNRIDIALISETHFTNSSRFNLPGFQIFRTNHPDDIAHAGAAIIIISSLLFYPLPPYKTDHIQAAGISLTLNNIPINIYAVYCPPRHTITLNQFNNFFLSLGQKFIIGELIWAQVKGEIANKNNSFKITDVENLANIAIESVTVHNWKRNVDHCERLQDEDFIKEGFRDQILEPIVLIL
ncbi:Endonuclease/exonuclease/phosphatase [Cinara cedri]|uniref:Endonuclease/exonuclease/phosphatase n=1 Tax=Cinara cedri TaxID=506608 RepID=A0A5E4MMQ8_9HEMI|nr:Endonuclease/exonuclease/phosphatase [Cinara cedri]